MIEYGMSGSHLGGKSVYIISWKGMATGESGNSLPLAQYADRSVQVEGTFGAGGVISIQGSNDGVNYVTLTDPQGNPLSFTSAGLEAITEMVAFIRPVVLSGDGTTNINVTMACRA